MGYERVRSIPEILSRGGIGIAMNCIELDYRSFIQEELEVRCQRNRHYSMRAFSRDVDLSVSFLSQLLRRQKSIGHDKAKAFLENVSWPKEKKEIFLQLIELESIADEELKSIVTHKIQEKLSKNSQFSPLGIEQFRFISDWYHLPILEMYEVFGEDLSSDDIAKKLDLDETIVEFALERLERLGLIEHTTEQNIRKTKNNRIEDIPSKAIRKFHASMIEKASNALKEQSFESRVVTGLTVSISSKKLPEANECIQRFLMEMSDLFEKQEEKDSVYQLNVQLFDLLKH